MPRAFASAATAALTVPSSVAATARAAPSRSSGSHSFLRSEHFSSLNSGANAGLTTVTAAPHFTSVAARRAATPPPPAITARRPSMSVSSGKSGGLERPSIRRAQSSASAQLWPSSSSRGRSIMMTRALQLRAASSFSSMPPAAPPSFVTSQRAPVRRIISSFMSRLKGPCIAMMWPLSKPQAAHFFITSGSGSTLAKRRERALTQAKASSSLLPVVSSALPVVSSRRRAASSALFTRMTSSSAALSLRCTRISGVPEAAQAARIFSRASRA